MCSCQAGKVNGVETTEWGPHYWRAIHKLSLRAGTLADANSQAEEMRSWTHIFKETAKAIPCEDCRTHYAAWILANPIAPLKELPYSQKGEWIRDWWWRLHGDIDLRLGKTSVLFSDLGTIFSGVFVRFEIATIDKYIKKATVASQVKLFDYKEWKRAIVILNSLYY